MKDKLNDLIEEVSNMDLDTSVKASALYKISRKVLKAELIFTLTKDIALLSKLEGWVRKWKT